MRVFVLGTAQDGGVPQMDCLCPHCRAADADAALRRLPACAAVQAEGEPPVLVDATPSLPEQARLLRRLTGGPGTAAGPSLPFQAILLTHAHMGHYAGLLQLGREAAHAQLFPVYGTSRMEAFLAENRPFAHLFERREIRFNTVEPGRTFALGGLSVTALPVPHRNEDTDTVAYRIQRDGLTFLYVPDADAFPPSLVAEIRAADLALVDGTFYTHDEAAPRREDLRQIPHPPIAESRKALARPAGRVLFTHLNHTNRLLSDPSIAADLAAWGLGVAADGQVHAIARATSATA